MINMHRFNRPIDLFGAGQLIPNKEDTLSRSIFLSAYFVAYQLEGRAEFCFEISYPEMEDPSLALEVGNLLAAQYISEHARCTLSPPLESIYFQITGQNLLHTFAYQLMHNQKIYPIRFKIWRMQDELYIGNH